METKIVSEFGKEFDVDEVYKSESVFIDSLASVEEFRHVEVPPGAPPSFDEQMLEEVGILFELPLYSLQNITCSFQTYLNDFIFLPRQI